MPGYPVVFTANGGLPVTYAADGNGWPIEEAGSGLPVTEVSAGGLPVAAANAEAAQLMRRFATAPSSSRARRIDALVGSLKAAGVWSKLDALYITAAADAQAAQRNWVADAYNLTPANAPTFVADQGYTGDGSTSYLDTSFNPTTAVLPKFTQDSASLLLWSRTNLANGAGTSLDAGGGNSYLARDVSVAGRATARVNTSVGGLTVGTGAYPGLSAWTRSAADLWEGYAQGVDAGGGTNASAAPANAPFRIGSTGAGSFGVNQIAAFAFGQNLTATEVLAAYTAINAYMVAIGAA